MPCSRKVPSVSVGLVQILKNYAGQAGLDFDGIAAAAGIDTTILGDNRNRVAAPQFELLWRQVVSAADDPHPGLHFGCEVGRHFPGGSILFTMMMNCATIGHALDAFIRYHRMMTDIIQPELHQDSERIHLSWDGLNQGFSPQVDLSEAIICIYYAILRHLSHGRLEAVEVCFTHPAPDNVASHLRIFACPIRFAAEKNELVIDRDALGYEIHLANREMYEILEKHAARQTNAIGDENYWSKEVSHLSSVMIMKGDKPNIDSIAKKLAVSRRGLQTRLKAEETSFRCCLETVRKQLALEFLDRDDISICEVAFLLGYSEQSAFNHAFKRWTGKAPQASRRRQEKCGHRAGVKLDFQKNGMDSKKGTQL